MQTSSVTFELSAYFIINLSWKTGSEGCMKTFLFVPCILEVDILMCLLVITFRSIYQ